MSKQQTQDKKKPGRPKISKERLRSRWIGAAVKETEKKEFELRASREGVSESELVRVLCGIDPPHIEAEKKSA